MYVILVYDISTDGNGSKTWRRTFKTCKKYLHHVQKSVFEGEIEQSQLMKLRMELKRIIRNDMDSVIVYKNKYNIENEREFWGIIEDRTDNFL